MAFLEQKLNLKLSQKLTLTPALQQAIKLLQMTSVELQSEIKNELLENPLLEDVENSQKTEVKEVVDTVGETNKAETNAEDPLHSSDLNIEEYFKDYVEDEYVPSFKYTEDRDKDSYFENTLTETESLAEHLKWQLQLNIDESELLEILDEILPYINDDGYFIFPEDNFPSAVDWLANELNLDKSSIKKCIIYIQELDPSGVGASSLSECLLIQAKHLGFGNDNILTSMLSENLNLVASQQYDKLKDLFSLNTDELEYYIDFIRSLEPKPGRRFSSDKTVYVTPDVYVYKVDNEYQIQLNEDGLPHLRVNKSYALIATTGVGEKETVSYVKNKLKSAIWIIKSIQNRQRTIFKVARSIVKNQKNFLDLGLEYINPLTLKDIAEDIEMHESTVARVVKNKYIHTPRGLFEFKYFFSSKLSSNQGSDVSSKAVKEKIKKIIETESKKKPYSDNAVVTILKSHGINIARRTVAKYREELRILSSSDRKKNYRRDYDY